MARNPQAQKFATEIEPNFDGGLVQNTFVKGTLFIFQTIEQRNNLGPLYRQLDNETTTLALVVGGTSDVFYKLISNPEGTTTDADWKEIPLGAVGAGPQALGEWDAATGNVVETGDPLLDTQAAAENGNYYVVANSPNGTTNTYPGLFRSIQVSTFNGDTILSVGNYWAIIRPAVTWETLNVPDIIRQYELGNVQTHNQPIATIDGLTDELATKFDADDVANIIQNFDDIPGAKLVDLTFTRNYYYRRFIAGLNKSDSTYNAAEIDNLISGATAALFDWNRKIRRLPKVGEIPGGTITTEGLEEIYYGIIETTSELTSIDVMQIGESTNPRIRGVVTANDGTIQLIQIVDEDDLVVGLPTFTPGDPVVNVDIALPIAIVPEENDTTNYRIRAQVIYPPDLTTIDVDSDAVTIDTVYPYLFGMETTGLLGTNIYARLTPLVSLEKNQLLSFTGTQLRVYFAFPTDYTDLISIQDESKAETLDSYAEFSLTVDSAGLTTNWTKNYKVYELRYDISLDTHFINFLAFPLEIDTLDDIAEGDVNKHFTVSEKNKLAGLPSGGDIGDMDKSVYDPDLKDYVKYAEQSAIDGFNDTGTFIGQNKIVNFLEWDSVEHRVKIQLADNQLDRPASGFALTDVVDQDNAIIVRSGIIEGVNTAGAAVRDLVYLSTSGNFQLTAPPSSGTIQPIGIVIKVDASDGAIFFGATESQEETRFPPTLDWVPSINYNQNDTVFYQDGTTYAQFRATLPHAAGTDFLTDLNAGKWEAVSGDMLSIDYDPTDKRSDVYDMDNMVDGASFVAMTTGERTKLAGLEAPNFKGTFQTPDDLRIAFPTADPGDNANVVFENDGTTPNGNNWIWDTLAPPNVSPPTVGGDWVDSGIVVGGNMRTETYDPFGISSNAFGMEFMQEEAGVTGPEAKIYTQDERTKLAGIEAGAEVNEVDEVPGAGEYVRELGAWNFRKLGPLSQDLIVRATAVSGKSFAVGECAQVTDSFIKSPADELYNDFSQVLIDEIQAAAAYDLPATQRAEGTTESSFVNESVDVAGEGIAKRFDVADLTANIGAVDWEITYLRINGNMNSTERTNMRFAVYSDVGGQPGVEISPVTNFDYSTFVNDGENIHTADAFVPVPVLNGQTFWIVGLFANQPGPAVYTCKDNWGSDGSEGNRADYITVDADPTYTRFTTDGGSSWGATTTDRIMRLEVGLNRTTAVKAPTSIYGICLDAINDSTEGSMVLQGVINTDTTGTPFGETWFDNDFIYVDVVTNQLTRVAPANPRDEIIMGQVLRAAPIGSLAVTAGTTGVRGVFLTQQVYDPTAKQTDIFNLNNIDRGTLSAARVEVDDSDFDVVIGDTSQEAFASIDDKLFANGITSFIPFFHSSFELGPFTTTSTTFQTALSDTEFLEAGNYIVTVSYGWNHDDTGSDFESRVLVDGILIGDPFLNGVTHKQEPQDSGGSGGISGTSQQMGFTLKEVVNIPTNGLKSVLVEYRTDSGGDESTIWNIMVEIRKIS